MQAQKFGAVITSPCAVTSLDDVAGHIVPRLPTAPRSPARPSSRRPAPTTAGFRSTSLEQYEMAGVYYAATELEARRCAGAPVVVVGGGNSAGQAAMFLSEKRLASVCIVVRRPLAATMSTLPRRSHRGPSAGRGPRRHHGHRARRRADAASASRSRARRPVDIDCTALFSFIGAEPNSGWLGDVAIDEHGFVLTDRALDVDRSATGWDTTRPSTAAVRDQPPRTVRRRRPPLRFDQAGRRRGRRGLRRDPLGPRAPRGHGRQRGVAEESRSGPAGRRASPT